MALTDEEEARVREALDELTMEVAELAQAVAELKAQHDREEGRASGA